MILERKPGNLQTEPGKPCDFSRSQGFLCFVGKCQVFVFDDRSLQATSSSKTEAAQRANAALGETAAFDEVVGF